jgi:hypothetical protein
MIWWKFLVVWIEQTSYNIPPDKMLNYSMAPDLFSSMKVGRGAKAVEEKFETSKSWFMRVKDGRCTGWIAGSDVEATASYPEDAA